MVSEWTPPEDETFIDIHIGWFELCALRKDGSAICWDIWDNVGEVTSPEEKLNPRHSAFRSFVNQRFTIVSIGRSGECSLREEDGSAVCWSDDPTSTAPLPVPAPAGESFTVISDGGRLYACAFDKSGSPVCWDYAQDSLPSDRLFAAIISGPGSTCGIRLEDGSAACWGLITEYYSPPPAGETFSAISTGDGFACALRDDGLPVCWGRYDSPGGAASPPTDERFSTISSGRYHACGIRSEDGSPVCWGLPDFSYDSGQAAPPGGERLQRELPKGERFRAIDAGYGYVCALRQDGSPICAGVGASSWSVPPEGETFTTISTGIDHACGLREDGSPVCWGPGLPGQEDVDELSPPGGETFRAISSGMYHTCGLREDGSPVCWISQNVEGEHDNSELLIDPPEGEAFKAISCGVYHTCGLREDGSPVCWASVNIEDEFMDPERIHPPEGETFTTISSGFYITCGLRQDGSPVCWGHIAEDEESDPELLNPPEGESFKTISSGYLHACALRLDGSPVCWGLTWGMVPENELFTTISSGIDTSTWALREDGSVVYW